NPHRAQAGQDPPGLALTPPEAGHYARVPMNGGFAMRPAALLLSCAASLALSGTAAPATFYAREMMKLKRLADAQVSPDGRGVAYTATEVEMPSGARNAEIWVVPVTGGEPRRITNDPKSDSRPRWSPDGKTLGFLSSRDGASQVYAAPPDGTA